MKKNVSGKTRGDFIETFEVQYSATGCTQEVSAMAGALNKTKTVIALRS